MVPAVRRFLLLLMLCLLPLQVSWAIMAGYCSHEHGPAHHFGHHDQHKAASDIPDDGKQPAKSGVGHDHCHLPGFLGILTAFTLTTNDLSQSCMLGDDCVFSRVAPDQPERPNWTPPA